MSLQKIGEAMKFKVMFEQECSSLEEARDLTKRSGVSGAVITVWRDHKWVPLEICFTSFAYFPMGEGLIGLDYKPEKQ